MDTTNKRYFDADKLIRDIHNKIVIWHNNDDRLNPTEMGRELRFLSQEIAEDVLKAVHGDDVSIEIDKHKLGIAEEPKEEATSTPDSNDIRASMSSEHDLTEDQVSSALMASREHRLQEKKYLEERKDDAFI